MRLEAAAVDFDREPQGVDWSGQKKDGGARRDRTADLVIANDALSQLSYGPAKRNKR